MKLTEEERDSPWHILGFQNLNSKHLYRYNIKTKLTNLFHRFILASVKKEEMAHTKQKRRKKKEMRRSRGQIVAGPRTLQSLLIIVAAAQHGFALRMEKASLSELTQSWKSLSVFTITRMFWQCMLQCEVLEMIPLGPYQIGVIVLYLHYLIGFEYIRKSPSKQSCLYFQIPRR